VTKFFRAPLVPDREQLQWEYFDVSDDLRARAVFDMLRQEHPEAIRELAQAGFRPIGRALGVIRGNRASVLSEVWVGDDGRMLASVGPRGGSELGTLFEDGTIVKTAERPPLLDWLTIGMEVAPRQRGSGHYFRTVPGDFGERMASHRALVARFERGSPVVREGSMKVHFAMRLRVAELRDARIRAQQMLTLWVGVLLGAAFAVGAILVRHRLYGRLSFGATELVGLSASLVASVPAYYAAKWWLAPALVRLRRPPPPRPAAELLAMAERVQPGSVRRRGPRA